MPRKSSIDKLSQPVRSHIERALRENRLTLDELIQELQEQFPRADKPSRSAIGRYKVSFDEMARRLREQQAMASLLVEELGENPDDKAGALMVQSITTLTNHAAMAAQVDEETTVDDVRKLARAARDVLAARKISREERKDIEREAREALLAEQEENLQQAARAQGMDADQVQFWREKVLGIR